MNKILYIINDLDFFISHRLPIAVAAKKAGHKIFIGSSSNSKNIRKIKGLGFKFYPIPISRSKKNFFKELILLISLFFVFIRVRPDIVQLITIKPLIYGGIISRILNIKLTIFTIAGLGYVYNNNNYYLRKIVLYLLKFSLKQKRCVLIMQNPSDMYYLKKEKVIKNQKIIFTKGSGIDLNKYKPKKKNNSTSIILASRMIREKGIFEFSEAAKNFYKYNKYVKFILIGKHDPESPSHIPYEALKNFNNKKDYPNLKWIGFKKNIMKYIQNSTVVVLPSYHEGVPKVLLEAAACGKPIIASNIGGCKEVVEENKNGLLIKIKNVKSLENSFIKILSNKKKLVKMGKYSRSKALKEFGLEKVVYKHLEQYKLDKI